MMNVNGWDSMQTVVKVSLHIFASLDTVQRKGNATLQQYSATRVGMNFVLCGTARNKGT